MIEKNYQIDLLNRMLDESIQNTYQQRQKQVYLGASLLGEKCARKLQYQIFGSQSKLFPKAVKLRLLDTGHHLEKLVAKWVRNAGYDLRTKNDQGKQFGFVVEEEKIAGRVDGIIVGGPKGHSYPLLWECKTMNNKNWRQTVRRGIETSNFIYFIQVQIYMAYMGFNQTLITVLNKNNSELHHEIVTFDPVIAEKYFKRGMEILKACSIGKLLPRISRTPKFYKCKMCQYRKACWKRSEH